jgi:large subunit ribosomal protein L24
MKKEFSTAWKASKQPRKQRKYLAKAPLHLKRKILGSNLSKDLRAKYGIRTLVVRTGDKVKIMRGKFSGKQGKVIVVKTRLAKIYIEGMQAKKVDGSKVNVPLKASNLQIIELNLDDKKRMKRVKAVKKETPKKDVKDVKESKDKPGSEKVQASSSKNQELKEKKE